MSLASDSDGYPNQPRCARFACEAMATRFELLIPGDRLRCAPAAQDALDEIALWHRRLSYFDPASDVSRINASAASGPVRVDSELFRLLELCQQLHALTEGAFDPAIAAAMRAAGFRGSSRSEESVASARLATGFHLVELARADRTVRFLRPGVGLDLGAIGKGWALDRATERLREAGVAAAFLHGGTSSAVGYCEESDPPWAVRLGPDPGAPTADLWNGALGVSAPRGRLVDGSGHVLDPRTGSSAGSATLAAVLAGSAAEADALSTGLLVDGPDARWIPDGVSTVSLVGGAWRVHPGSATLIRPNSWAIHHDRTRRPHGEL